MIGQRKLTCPVGLHMKLKARSSYENGINVPGQTYKQLLWYERLWVILVVYLQFHSKIK